MDPRLKARIALSDAMLIYKRQIDAITGTALAGGDSVESAAKVSVLAGQMAAASHEFYERLSLLHAVNLGIDPDEEVLGHTRMIKPNAPSENADDFAGWAKEIARERTFGPIQPLQAAE